MGHAIINRITAATNAFADNEDEGLDSVYVTEDGECFRKDHQAAAHAKDKTGDSTDYVNIESADLDVTAAIDDATDVSHVDGVIDGLDKVKDWIQDYADERKAELDESGRVTTKLAVIAACVKTSELNQMTHGETDSSVLSAITARKSALSNVDEPAANFSSSQGAGHTMNFTDTSTGTPTAWSWEFGDGTTASTQNPSHTYSGAATYKVVLKVTNAAGNDFIEKSVVVA